MAEWYIFRIFTEYMLRSSYFQVSADASSSNGWYHIGSNDELLFMAISLWKLGTHSLTMGQAVFLPKSPDQHQRAAWMMSYAPPCAISCHFFAIKTPVLWVASSLWADIDLVGTNPEDQDSLLDNGFAEVFLRVHLQQVSCVFV